MILLICKKNYNIYANQGIEFVCDFELKLYIFDSEYF